MKGVAAIVVVAVIALGSERSMFSQATPAAATFHNPLKSSGPDPWVIQQDGFFIRAM